jgi:hypothetical protein
MSDILKKTKQLTSPNNEWTNNKETLLKQWMNECNIYGKLYSYNVIRYEKLDSMLGIIAILLSTVTGTSLLNQSGSIDDSTTTRNILIFMGTLSVLNTFIQGSKEYLNLKSSINSNLIASRQNRMIALEINTQLTLTRQERKPGKDFLINIKNKRNDLILNGPVISEKIWNKILPSLKSPLGMGNMLGHNNINNTIPTNNNIHADSSINIKDIETNKDYDEHKFYQNINNNNINQNNKAPFNQTIYKDNNNINDTIINDTIINDNKFDTNSINEYNNNIDSKNNYTNLNNNESDIKYNNMSNSVVSLVESLNNDDNTPTVTSNDIVMNNINTPISNNNKIIPRSLSQIHINKVNNINTSNSNDITNDILYIINDESSDNISGTVSTNSDYHHIASSDLIRSSDVSENDDDFINDIIADDEASNQILSKVEKLKKKKRN